jgi:hypothetical protein
MAAETEESTGNEIHAANSFRRPMRRLLLMIGCLAQSLTKSQGQGTINFNTHTMDVEAKFFMRDGTTPLAGTGYTAQLFAGPLGAAESALLPIYPTTTFRTGVAAGYLIPVGAVVVPNVPPGQKATMQLRVWDNAGGTIATWESATTKFGGKLFDTSPLGGEDPNGWPPTVPPDLVGLTSASFGGLPEPSALLTGTVALSVFGIVQVARSGRFLSSGDQRGSRSAHP